MADIPARAEIGVTTGPIRGSRKIHVGPLRVAMRAIDLEPSCGEPPLNVYDTSGPYTDPDARIDIMAGLPALRRDWIVARGDVESYDARAIRPGLEVCQFPLAAQSIAWPRRGLLRELVD